MRLKEQNIHYTKAQDAAGSSRSTQSRTMIEVRQTDILNDDEKISLCRSKMCWNFAY